MMTDLEIADAMLIYGGSFVQALSRAFIAADSMNRETLKAAFPDVFANYTEMARLRLERAQKAQKASRV